MNDFISEGKKKRKTVKRRISNQRKPSVLRLLSSDALVSGPSFHLFQFFSQFSCVSHYRFSACTFTLYSATYRKVFVFVEHQFFWLPKLGKGALLGANHLLGRQITFGASDIILFVLCIILTRGTARWSIILLSCDKTNMYRCDLLGYCRGRFGLTHVRVGKDGKKERK